MKSLNKIILGIFIASSLLLCPGTASARSSQLNLNHKAIPSLDCVHESESKLIFPSGNKSMYRFYAKLASILNGDDKTSINIVHIGNSHVQAGVISCRLRDDFQSMHDTVSGARIPGGNRGMVFPFKVARTNGPSDIKFSSTGSWSRSRCLSRHPDAVLGLSGNAIITSDPRATLTMTVPEKYAFKQLRLLGYAHEGVRPVIELDGEEIAAQGGDQATGYLFTLPHAVTSCKLEFQGAGQGRTMVVRGLVPISQSNGLTYSASGVNGASLPAWLRCDAMPDELKLFNPDLVVLAIGVNDAAGAPGSFSPEKFKERYRQLIARLREVAPQAALLFITNNDCGQSVSNHSYNSNTPLAEQAFLDLAREYGAGVFDVFRIMGGSRSAATWVKNGLQSHDMVHFTSKGYTILADLLYNALVDDFTQYYIDNYSNQ